MCRTAGVPRSRVLLEGEKEDGAKPSVASQAQMAAGGGAALAGGGLIAWEHSTFLLSTDVLGGSLVLVGAAIAAAATPQARAALFGESEETKKTRAQFKFTLLNDDASHAQARADLEKATAASDLGGLPAGRQAAGDARAGADPRDARPRPAGCQFVRARLGAGEAGAEGGQRRGDDVRMALRPWCRRRLRPRPRSWSARPGAGVAASEVARLLGLLEGVASPRSELVVRVTSPGGAVAEFGLMAASLLTAAASEDHVSSTAPSWWRPPRSCVVGGIAAPFAFVGSIGVVAALPNFHRVLTKAESYSSPADKHKRCHGRKKAEEQASSRRSSSSSPRVRSTSQASAPRRRRRRSGGGEAAAAAAKAGRRPAAAATAFAIATRRATGRRGSRYCRRPRRELATSHKLLREHARLRRRAGRALRQRSPLAMLTGAVHEAVGAVAAHVEALAFPRGAAGLGPEPALRDDTYRHVRASG